MPSGKQVLYFISGAFFLLIGLEIVYEVLRNIGAPGFLLSSFDLGAMVMMIIFIVLGGFYVFWSFNSKRITLWSNWSLALAWISVIFFLMTFFWGRPLCAREPCGGMDLLGLILSTITVISLAASLITAVLSIVKNSAQR